MTYNKQDIILVPFPFSDKPGFKKRPAVIISSKIHFDDYGKYICLAITSQEKRSNSIRYEHKLSTSTSAGLLYEDQWVLPNKVFSIESKMILKRLGTMDKQDYDIVERMFNEIITDSKV